MENQAFLFAGQGAQYVGMGKTLAESFSQSRSLFERADRSLGVPISELCFEGPAEELKRTQNCQPAILTVSIAAFEAYKAILGFELSSISYMAGLSLGEYSALVASGALSFEDALYLVRRRGEFMEEEALKNPGGMLSIIGMDLEKVKTICLKTGVELANLNCPGQIVVSGGLKDIEAAGLQAQAAGARMVIPLEVSGAFHSSYMKEASLRLAGELDKITIKAPVVPVVSNVTAGLVGSPEEIKANLVAQVCSSVLWEPSMKFILSKGVTNFVEFGPGKILKGLMRRIEPAAKVLSIENKEDIKL